MLHKTKLKLVFWCSLIAGVALCIGGIWLAPLLVPGGILLAGSLAMYQSAYAAEVVDDHIAQHLDMVQPNAQPQENGMHVTQNVGLFFMYRPRSDSELTDSLPERPRNPSPRLTLT